MTSSNRVAKYRSLIMAVVASLLMQPAATSVRAATQVSALATTPLPASPLIFRQRNETELLISAPGTFEVSASAISPSTGEVNIGQVVSFVNTDSTAHTLRVTTDAVPTQPTQRKVYLPLVTRNKTGTTATLTSLLSDNRDAAPKVFDASGESISLAAGQTVTRTFANAGNYNVYDEANPTIKALLLITPLPIDKSGSLFGNVRRFDSKAVLAGVQVKTLELGNAYIATSDAQGNYLLNLPAGDYTLVVFANGYTFSNRKVTVQSHTPAGIEPLELVPLDTNVTPIGGGGGSASNSANNTNIVVLPGAVNTSKPFRLTDLPVDEFQKDFSALPGPFNNGRIPLGFVLFEPEGTQFTTAVTWTIDYTGTLPVGTYVPCFYWLEAEARWGDPVDGYVVDLGGGKKGLRAALPHFSAYGFAAPPPNPQPNDPPDDEDPDNNPNDPDNDECAGSQLNTFTGELCQTVGTLSLPSAGSLPMQITAKYHSLDASNNTGFTTQFKKRPNSGNPTLETWRYETAGRVFSGTGSIVNVNWNGLSASGNKLPPGSNIGRLVSRVEYQTANGWSIFETPMTYTVPIRRADLSPFGAGWFSSHDMLLVDRGDLVSILQSSGVNIKYTKTITGYVPQAGEFSTLTKNGDGTWTRAFRDGSALSFNADGRLSRIADRYGNNQVLLYESNGKSVPAGEWGLTKRLKRITDSSGNTFDYAYDANGWLSSITDNAGRAYGFEHDAQGQLTATIDPIGQRQTFTYDANGLMNSHTDKRGAKTTYVLDSRGRVTSRAWPTGTSLNVTYAPTRTTVLPDRGGPWVTTVDAAFNPAQKFNGVYTATTTYNDQKQAETMDTPPQTLLYDAKGNVITSVSGEAVKMAYAGPFEQISAMESSAGGSTQFSYDAAGNLIRMTDALGQQYNMTYDSKGQMLSLADPLGNAVNLLRNAKGQTTTRTDALNRVTNFSYNAAGTLASVTDPLNRTTRMGHDALNRMTVLTDALGGQVRMAYDPNSNLTGVTDQSNRSINYVYDALDRPTQITYADGGSESMAYDGSGNLTSVNDARGVNVAMTYDAANRVTRKVVQGGPTTNYQFDNLNQLTNINDGFARLQRYYVPGTTGTMHSQRTKLAGLPYDTLVQDDFGFGYPGRNDQFAIAIGDIISDGQPGPGAGAIEGPNLTDVYVFTATPGQAVYFDSQVTTNSYIDWELRDSANARLFGTCLGCGDPGNMTLTLGGTYTLTLGGDGDTGSYRVQLWNVPAPSVYNIAIGAVISPDTPAAGAGIIETPGTRDVYVFTAPPGQMVYFDSQFTANSYIDWELRDSANTRLFGTCLGCGSPGNVTLTRGGTYTLTLGGDGDTGSYRVQLWNVPAPSVYNIAIGAVISPDNPAAGAGIIETPGTRDVYVFTATPGQVVYFDSQFTANSYIDWELRDSANTRLFGTCLGCGDPGNMTLTLGGTYTLTLGGDGDTGSYRVQLWNVPAPSVYNIAIGAVISPDNPAAGAGIIETPGTRDVYVFTATPGQVVYFDSQFTANSYIDWELRDSANTRLFGTCLGCGDPGNVTLTLGGAYTLTLGGDGDTGTYRVQLINGPLSATQAEPQQESTNQPPSPEVSVADAVTAVEASPSVVSTSSESLTDKVSNDETSSASTSAGGPPNESLVSEDASIGQNLPLLNAAKKIWGTSVVQQATNIVTVTGQINANTTWISSNVYVINSDLTIIAGVKLTIEPGTIVKLRAASTELVVQGELIALGATSNPILFTSTNDDLRGGDMEGDGFERAQRGDWGRIYFQTGSRGRVVNAIIAFGGGAGGELVRADSTDVEMTHVIFQASQNKAVYSQNGGIAVTWSGFLDIPGFYVESATPSRPITATYNYWNSISGPTITGDARAIIVRPWSTAAQLPGGGRLASERISANTNRSQEQHYTYDVEGQLKTLQNSGYSTYTLAYVYDAAGRLTNRSAGAGAPLSYGYQYNKGSEITQLNISSGAGTTLREDYTYDAVGNVSSANSSRDGNTTYTYDALNRLTGASNPSFAASYAYDAAGNRTSAGGTTYTYDAGGRLTSASDGTTYAYDAAGNLASKTKSGQTTSYVWDGQNRLARINYTDGSYSAYQYDDLGRRISKRTPDGATTYFVYAGMNLVQELNASGSLLASYSYDGLDQPISMWRGGVTYFYVLDRLGSVLGLADGNGTMAATYRYDPWGNVIATTGSVVQPFRFTGREWDAESGLYYYRFRYYDAGVGRFISRDPTGIAHGLNLYAYAENKPTKFTDPSGLGSDGNDRARCAKISQTIENIKKDIEKRERELEEDRDKLPETCPGDDKQPKLSREGHRRIIRELRDRITDLQGEFASRNCGRFANPNPAPQPETEPSQFSPPNIDWQKWALIGAGIIIIGGLIYFSGGLAIPVLAL